MYKIIKLDTVTSTNDYLFTYDKKVDKLVVISNEQTKGKGRRGKDFISLKNKGLFFSVLFLNRFGVEEINKLTVIGTLSIINALNKFDVDARIKWLNDVYLNNKKLAGVLVETRICDNKFCEVVIGIGINLKDIDNKFSSLEGQTNITKEGLFNVILKELDELISWSDNELYNEYVKYLMIDKKVDCKDLDFYNASIIGIDTNYQLIVKSDLDEVIVLDGKSTSLELE